MKHLSIDGFAGGGGASCGLKMAGIDVTIAINHDPAAIRMHTVNHPRTLHLTEDIFKVDLAKYLDPDDVVDVMWASPDCTSHSKAKGGQPRELGLRILPWAVYRLCRQIKDVTGQLPALLMMENVEEIQEWGPLDKNGHPIERKKGREYRRFINAMKKIGFVFDSRVLIAADYGAPTTRKRWYAVFRSDGKPINWPEPTHCKNGGTDLLGTRLPWVPVSTCLDFTDLGASIFERKKPLADATLKRIANGIKKFVVENPTPYFLPEQQALPFLIQYHSETTESVRGQKVTEPLKTIDTSNRYALISVFVTKFYKTGTGQEVTEPLHTITTSPGHFGLVSVFLIKYYGTETSGHSVNEPLATITTKDRFGMVSTILLKNGERYAIADIYMRMLKPEELKLAQGFPKDYVIDHDIDGNPYPIKEQVAKIGNSVVPIMAMKIAKANIVSM
jgi:DNA (cytosine-5)-methyltransferase 1